MKAPLSLGQSIVRREDARLLTGRGRYTDDTVPAGTAAVLTGLFLTRLGNRPIAVPVEE